MKARILSRTIILLSLFISAISNSSAQFPGTFHEFTIEVGEFTREYRLYEPTGHDGSEAWPMVVYFHGFGGAEPPSNTSMYNILGMIADTAKFFLGIPHGNVVYNPRSDTWGLGWHVPGTYSAGHNDSAFIAKMIDELTDNPDFEIDEERIHTTGFSNGGQMTFYTTCILSHKVASVAGVGTQMLWIMMDSICTPERQYSILHIHGTDDAAYPRYGNQTFPPLEGTSEYWAEIDDCNLTPIETELPDIDPNDGTTVTLFEYEDCDFNFEVRLYRVNGGDHCWPGEWDCNNDIIAGVEAWEFFKRNPHPGELTCYTDGITFTSQSLIDYFPTNYPDCVYIGGDVTISGNNITNLDSLSQVYKIEGNLVIDNNPTLESITGLGNLEEICGDFLIYSNNIEDFSGLANLKTIDGDLKIAGNTSLLSLSGLDSIAPGSIHDLTIAANPVLSECNVYSICEYIAAPGGTVIIQGNDMGCESLEVLYDICWNGVDENQQGLITSIYPNPFNHSVTIEYNLRNPGLVQIKLFNPIGKLVEVLEEGKQKLGIHKVEWNADGSPSGVYFCVLKTGGEQKTVKLVKLE